MATSINCHFLSLTDFLRRALASNGSISIPTELVTLFSKATQPFEDTGLDELVMLFDTSHTGVNYLRFEPRAFACFVQIVFRLRPSLKQQKFLHLLVAPIVIAGSRASPNWHAAVAKELIPGLLKLIQKGFVVDELLVTATQLLLSLLDSKTKRIVYDGEDGLRRALGSIICSHKNYTLRIAVANLVRELLVGRFDRHLFWPEQTPNPSYQEFPLAETGDPGWMVQIFEFLSELIAAQGFRTNLPEVYHVEYMEEQTGALAVVSNGITFVLPANTSPLHFLEIPITVDLKCQQGNGQILKMIYEKRTGYQTCEGVKGAVEEVVIGFKDTLQRKSFIKSVKSKQEERISDVRFTNEPSTPRRSVYASIDFSESRETSIDSDLESDVASELYNPVDGDAQILEFASTESQGQVQSEHHESRHMPELGSQTQLIAPSAIPPNRVVDHAPTDLVVLANQALSATSRKMRPHDLGSTQQEPSLSETRRSKDDRAAPKEVFTSSIKTNTNQPVHAAESHSQRRLKRPSAKSAKGTNGNDIDWDEDMRADEVEQEAPAAKKSKPTSQKTKKPVNFASSKISQVTPKTANKRTINTKPASNSATKAKPKVAASKTITSTRARRSVAVKSTTYAEDSDSDSDEDDERESVQEQDSNSMKTKEPSRKAKVQAGDSQGREKLGQIAPTQQSSMHMLPEEEASPQIVPDVLPGSEIVETAHDSHPMDAAKQAQAIDQSDTSFGSKMAQVLGQEIQSITHPDQLSRKSFGNAKTFVQVVNENRKSSPLKDIAGKTEQAASTSKQDPHVVTADQEMTEYTGKRPSTQATSKAPFVWRPDVAASIELSPQRKEVRRTFGADGQEASSNGHDESLVLDVVVLKKVAFQREAAKNDQISGDNGQEDRNDHIDEPAHLSLTAPASSAIVASRSSPLHPFTKPSLQELSARKSLQQTMGPPSHRSRHSEVGAMTPTNSTISREDGSSLATDERVHRKPPIVSFSAKGPRNQGLRSPDKIVSMESSSIMSTSQKGDLNVKEPTITEPLEAEQDEAKSPAVTAPKNNISAQQSVADDEEDEIPVHEDTFLTAAEIAVTDAAIDTSTLRGNSLGRNMSRNDSFGKNASQSSKVDENGSPHLSQSQISHTRISAVPEMSAISEQSDDSAVASEEPEQSDRGDNSDYNAALQKPYPHPFRSPSKAKAKKIQSRPSIGLNDIILKKWQNATKTVNTAAFKKQKMPAFPKAPIVVEKAIPIGQIAKYSERADTDDDAQPIISEQVLPAVDSPNRQPQPRTHRVRRVVRSGLKNPADISKQEGLETASTPASFKTGLKSMLMPPPPLPFPKTNNSDATPALIQKGKKVRQFITDDADLTLVDEEYSTEPLGVRTVSKPQRRQSPDSSSGSQSSPPESVPQIEKNAEDHEAQLTPVRATQVALRNVLQAVNSRLLFRLERAEQDIECKTNEYNTGSRHVIDKLDDTYGNLVDHERSKATPLIACLHELYNTAIEQVLRSQRKIGRSADIGTLSNKIEMRRTYLLSRIDRQMEGSEVDQQEAE